MKSLDEVIFYDVRQDGVAPDVLESAYAACGHALLNTRSATWRALTDTERAVPPLELLTTHPTLMKRPLIEKDGQFYLGWGKDVQAQLLG